MIKKLLAVFVILVLILLSFNANLTRGYEENSRNYVNYWAKTYDAGGNDRCEEIIRTEDGYLVIGCGNIIKIDSVGNIIQAKTYSEWGLFYAGKEDLIWAKQIDISNNSNYLILCCTNSTGYVKWVLKFVPKLKNNTHLWISKVLKTDDGYLMVGTKTIPNTEHPMVSCPYEYLMWILKISNDGELMWQKVYKEQNFSNFFVYSITPIDNTTYFVASTDTLLKIDSNGNLIDAKWTHMDIVSLRKTFGNTFFAITHMNSYPVYLRIDKNMNIVWSQRYVFPWNGHPNNINNVESIGGFDVGDGYIIGMCLPWEYRNIWDNFIMFKIDYEGNVLWAKMYGGNGSDKLRCITEAVDGGYILCGESDSFNNNTDIWIVKTDKNGNIVFNSDSSAYVKNLTIYPENATIYMNSSDIVSADAEIDVYTLDPSEIKIPIKDTQVKVRIQAGLEGVNENGKNLKESMIYFFIAVSILLIPVAMIVIILVYRRKITKR